MPAIEFIGYRNLLPGPLRMHNNGHSGIYHHVNCTQSMNVNEHLLSPAFQVSLNIPRFPEAQGKIPYIFGGKLDDEYEFVGLHFHWGERNNRGSEHVYNELRFPMEMHLLHRNKKFRSLESAIKNHNGLAVTAYFFHVSDSDNAQLVNVIEQLHGVQAFNSNVVLNSTFTLSSLVGDVNQERFYMYKGSLTTPPCSEAVTWIIFPDPMKVSIGQVSVPG